MIRLVVGLGNVGEEYERTRHNVGFEIVRRALKLVSSKKIVSGKTYQAWQASTGEDDAYFILPTTYMNRSGFAIEEALERFEIEVAELLVLVDEFQLPLGAIRIRGEGSDGGHNGLTSVFQALGTEWFARLRMGVGPLPVDTNPADFVLSRFGKREEEFLSPYLDKAAEAVIFALRHPLEKVMGQFNSTPAPPV